MKKPSVFMVAVALLLLPGQALAGLCLKNQFNHNIFITNGAPAELGIAPIMGAWLFGGPPCNTVAFVGSAWLIPDGNAHIGISLNGPNGAGCSAYSVQFTLSAFDGFTVGTGYFQNLAVAADRGVLTLTAGSCPATIPSP